MKNIIDLYVAQHARALECAKEIVEASNTVGETKNNAEKIRFRLANLSGILKAHFISEDRFLYHSLITHSDPTVSGTAQRYWDEMGGITEAVMLFLDRWRELSGIEREPEAFLKESRDIFAALKKRIDAEESELYPLFLAHAK